MKQNIRRRDIKPENSSPIEEETNAGIMSDLNDFMMIEDFKIDEQEEKFIQQSNMNKMK